MYNENAVMPSLKGNVMVNVIPTKETVDYNRIYVYDDLDVVEKAFKMYEDNRTLYKTHISEIQADIDKFPYKSKFFSPLRVDINTMCIADGQHRLEAYKRAWKNGSKEPMRVIYEDYPTSNDGRDRMDIISRINGTNKNWGVNDHQHRLLAENNTSMVNIREFGMSHKLCQKKNKNGEVVDFYPRYAYAILLGRNATKEVKDGSIKASKKDLVFGEKMNGELEMLVDALGYEMNSWFESFAHAWYNIRQNDKANSSLIDELGLETICKHIYKFFNGWHPVTRKTEWENRFRTAIWEIKRGIETKTL